MLILRTLASSRCSRTWRFRCPPLTNGNRSWRHLSSADNVNDTSSILSMSSNADPFLQASLTPSWDTSVCLLATQAVPHNLAWYNTNGLVMDAVHVIHDTLGLSYAASIAALTLGMRACLILPLAIRALGRDPTLERDLEACKQKSQLSRTREERKELAAEMDALKKRVRWRRAEAIATPITTIATMIVVWSGVRHMVVYYPLELSSGGMFWFSDLTQSDIYYALPAAGTVVFLLMGELGSDSLGRPVREYGWKGTLFWRSLRLTFFPAFAYAPTAIFCYWLPHCTLAIIQSVVLANPKVKEALGVVPSVVPSKHTKVQYFDQDPTKGAKQHSSYKKGKRGKREQ